MTKNYCNMYTKVFMSPFTMPKWHSIFSIFASKKNMLRKRGFWMKRPLPGRMFYPTRLPEAHKKEHYEISVDGQKISNVFENWKEGAKQTCSFLLHFIGMTLKYVCSKKQLFSVVKRGWNWEGSSESTHHSI